MGNTEQFWHFLINNASEIFISVLPALCGGDGISTQRTLCTVMIRLSRQKHGLVSPIHGVKMPRCLKRKKKIQNNNNNKSYIRQIFFFFSFSLKT